MVLEEKKNPFTLGGKEKGEGVCGRCYRFFDSSTRKEITSSILYGGDFFSLSRANAKKFAAMAKKFNPDVVICGPCFNYANYGIMAAKSAEAISELTNIPAFAIMSQECEKAIETYKDKVTILKMPKKGGIGLNESLSAMCEYAKMLVDKKDTAEFLEKHAY